MDTRAPASCTSELWPPPEDIHGAKTPPRRTLHDDGQTCREGGHIGKHAESEEGEDAPSAEECGKGWGSIRVALVVGSAMNGTDANGPCWDRKRALGIIQPRPHFVADELVLGLPGCLLLPPLHLGLIGLRLLVDDWRRFCQFRPRGHLQTCTCQKHGASPCAKP